MTVKPHVAILEDDVTRVAAIRECLAAELPEHPAVFFDDAEAMVEHLREHLGEVVLISLDRLGSGVEGVARAGVDLLRSSEAGVAAPPSGRSYAYWGGHVRSGWGSATMPFSPSPRQGLAGAAPIPLTCFGV